jgi:hypothetical protein
MSEKNLKKIDEEEPLSPQEGEEDDETHTENENLIRTRAKKTKFKDRIKSALNSIENDVDEKIQEDEEQAEKSDEQTTNLDIDENKIKKRRARKTTIKNEGQMNEAFEENETAEKQNDGEKKKRRTRKKTSFAYANNNQDLPLEDQNILAVIVHQTDRLRTVINMYRPVVRIHILDLESDGQYVKKTKR